MATFVLIVQHAEKEPTGGDPGLTPLGQRQASATARTLAHGRRPAALYSSPMRRAVETAAPIAGLLGLQLNLDDRLRERMNWAGDESQSWESFLLDWTRASTDRDFVPPSGDSSRETGRRFSEAIDELARRHPGETIVVVAHGGATVDLLRNLIGDAGLTEAAPTLIDDGVPFCAVTRLEHREGRWRPQQIASTAHLDLDREADHDAGRPQSWHNVDADLRGFVEEAVGVVRSQLESFGYVGTYLHGSLAMGCFYRPKSDIDLLFVVEDKLTPDARRGIASALCQVSDQRPILGDVEASVLRRKHAQHFSHPLPFEVHYSETWKPRIERGEIDYAVDRQDSDLAAHCAVTRRRGIRIDGPPIADVFGDVPIKAYRTAVIDDLRWIVEDDHLLSTPFYGVLNCCRCLAQASTGWSEPLSKEEAAVWALDHLPARHGPIIRQALTCYRSSLVVPVDRRRTDGHAWDGQALRDFTSFMREQLPALGES